MRKKFGDRIEYTSDPMEALDGADALVICTNWGEFLHPDFEEIKQRLNTPLIFDGRNLYRPDQMKELGFIYYSVGRDTVGG